MEGTAALCWFVRMPGTFLLSPGKTVPVPAPSLLLFTGYLKLLFKGSISRTPVWIQYTRRFGGNVGSDPAGLGRAWEWTFLASSCLVLMVPACSPYLE